MNLLRHGEHKIPAPTLLASSRSLGWNGIAAEPRRHPMGDRPPFRSEQPAVTAALQGQNDAVVSRINEPLPAVIHLYLPKDRLAESKRITEGLTRATPALRYLAGIHDELLRQIALAVLCEVTSPTAAGKALVECLSLALVARLVSSYSECGERASGQPDRRLLIGDKRMRRVIHFMHEHLECNIGLEQLAEVACLSPFHFARTFRSMTGVPPHRYLSGLRMERAKVLIETGDRPLCDIALASGFSSQANFTRAFRRSVGATPLEYRKARRLP